VFMDAHLDNLPASAELSYGFRTSESGATTLDDSVTLSTRKDGDRGRVVNVDYLHGEHHLELPAVDHAQSNPVILYFLEHDVRDMHRRLGGQENYFRRRIRLAFAEAARMRPVNIRYAGRQVQATEVSVQPYADDPLKDRSRAWRASPTHPAAVGPGPRGRVPVAHRGPARRLQHAQAGKRADPQGTEDGRGDKMNTKLPLVLLVALAILPAGQAAARMNDFPTQERVEFVLECARDAQKKSPRPRRLRGIHLQVFLRHRPVGAKAHLRPVRGAIHRRQVVHHRRRARRGRARLRQGQGAGTPLPQRRGGRAQGVFHPLGATLLTVLCGWLAVARADVALPMTEVAPGVYVHSGHHEETDAANLGDIANIGFVVGEKCAAVVDSGGSMQVGRALLAALRRLTDRPVCYVVNTHMHPDHVFGNGAFAQLQPRPRFVGSARLPRALAERGEHYLASLSEALGEAAAGTRVVLPDLTVDGEMPLDLGGRTLTLRTWPTAHTNNDLTVFDEASGSLWLGDLLFETRIPSIDGSLRGWLAVMGELRQLTVRHAIPGHGAVDRPGPVCWMRSRPTWSAWQRAPGRPWRKD